mmetsp:Transcript_33600/g.88246  ORF Transcript_33600/g.88246 Transcript_33600/m.88246 type:complete len:551 (-) Transcript_33600:159-1811(-)
MRILSQILQTALPHRTAPAPHKLRALFTPTPRPARTMSQEDPAPSPAPGPVQPAAAAAAAAGLPVVAGFADLPKLAVAVLAPATLGTPEVRKSTSYEGHNDDMVEFSAVAPCVADRAAAIAIVDAVIAADPRAARAVGAMVGMAVADSVGHFFEFLPVVDQPFKSGHGVDISNLKYTGTYNQFMLEEGQWTDDTAMGLCLADSLLASFCRDPATSEFDGSDTRARFHAWWYHGYNNAFAEDTRRGVRVSVGLGGNISKSLRSIPIGSTPDAIFKADGEDAGNGSLMRLAPVPIRYWADPAAARRVAVAQSVTTHPGIIAACCCEFLAFAVQRAIAAAAPIGRAGSDGDEVVQWLDETAGAFVTQMDAEGRAGSGWDELRRLLASAEPDDSKERSWNWRAKSLDINGTLTRRGAFYNGYPVSPGYYGAFSIDGLAVALFSVRSTKSFNAAVERCVNFLGDADSTGSMVGQLAGAIYGMAAIDRRLVERMLRWDPRATIPLRAALLFAAGAADAPVPPAVEAAADLPRAGCGWETIVPDKDLAKKGFRWWPF